MERYLGHRSPYVYAVLRIVVGLMFMMHGTQKLFGVPGGRPPLPMASLPMAGGVIELICGLLIAIGLLTSWAAFVASGEMAVAYFTAHFPHSPLPIINKGELAVVYCFLFLYIALQGSGPWSLDRALRRGGSALPVEHRR